MEKYFTCISIVNVYPMNTTNNQRTDFLDILFEGRNKDYGAYDLRRTADRRVRNAIVGTASIALVIIGGYVVNNKLMAAETPKRIVEVFDTPEMKQLTEEPEKPVTPPPPPPSAPPPPAASSVRVTPPQIVEDDKVRPEDEVLPVDSMFNKRIDVVNAVGDPNGADNNPFVGTPGGSGPVVEPPKTEVHSDPLTWVEVMPKFPGGEEALGKYLSRNIHYPQMAIENGIEGKVFVQFVIDNEGKISHVETVGAPKGGGLEQEAIRVVKSMPKWIPGRQNGQSVSVRFNLPIGFQIN
ncbi:TonB family protein [Chitinophaga sp. ysch24]|uniref:TonB family protein n=2 Tax=Chitinophaga tropicalis TaxID=2683588 RepID=A0A7K1U9U4_9BACT|nr:TonB family protein [Chitinophaga tropicalis]